MPAPAVVAAFALLAPLSLSATSSTPPAPITRAQAIAEARSKNPSLRAAEARVNGARSAIGSARRLPDPVVKGELWGAPLAAPYDLTRSNAVMVGVRQELPLASFVDAKRDRAAAAADVERAALLGSERDVVRDVSAAFVRYRLAYEERALHAEHVRLSETTIDALRAAQASGRATEAEVSAAQVALTRAHDELLGIDADEASARAELNTAMARPADAPLGPPVDDDAAAADAVAADHGELATTNDAVLRAHAEAAMAEADARVTSDDAVLPTVMAGVDYMYMPAMPDPHGYGAMLSVSLPWLSFGRSGDVSAARERSDAAQAEAEAAELELQRMEAKAAAVAGARTKQLAVLERDELPAAERNVDAVRSAFAAGGAGARALLDANMMLLDARVRRARLRAALDLARIDLERIRGTAVGDAGRTAP